MTLSGFYVDIALYGASIALCVWGIRAYVAAIGIWVRGE